MMTKTLAFSTLMLVLTACGDGGGGGGGGSPCERLEDQCMTCANENAALRCLQAVGLGLDTTCQQLLDSGTYSETGVECTR